MKHRHLRLGQGIPGGLVEDLPAQVVAGARQDGVQAGEHQDEHDSTR